MKKGLLILLIIMLINAILSSCSAASSKQREDAVTAAAKKDAGSETKSAADRSTQTGRVNNDTATDSDSIGFEYFFRGFITLEGDQAESYPHETCIIETDEDWHDFMDKYVPGIPYYSSMDYSKEYLVVSILFPAKPSYSIGADIKTFKVTQEYLEPEYVNYGASGISNGIYAENTEDITHCFVNISKVKKNDIPENIVNIYKKNN